jgi:undecaprenyl-diphosphatase
MTIIQSIVFGIVEGITEFLPISSTAHLILTGKILGLEESVFLSTFEISIQLGAILAVVFLYKKDLFNNSLELFKKILVAFSPMIIIGFVFYKLVKNYLMNSVVIIAWALIIGGVLLILFEFLNRKNKELQKDVDFDKINYKKAFLIGIFQSFAIIPGVSRAAATIIGGLNLGLSRKTIIKFSFLLAVPTMIAATTLDLIKTDLSFLDFNMIVFWMVGFLVSFLMAFFSIKWLMRFLDKNNFIIFGIYRIIIGFLIFCFLI